MAININAKTTGVGGLETSADNSGEINIQSGGSTVMNVTSSGVAVTGSFSQNGAVYSTQPSFRNLIINGDMRIAQRGTSFNVVGSNTDYTVDRFALGIIEGDFTATQDTDTPSGQGFATSTKIDCNSTVGTLAAGTQNFFEQKIEAQNLQHLKYGTSNAETITLSFWVKSNKTGTYIMWLYAPSGGNMISNSYTISSANTWEKKTITIVGDTSSLAFANNTGIGLYVRFMIGAGSNYQASPLATSWTPITSATRYNGQVNLADSTSNYINITGVQLEVGSTATEFEHLPYDVELARCQRYAYKIGGDINTDYVDSAGGYYDANYISFGKVQFPVPMRTGPSATFNAGNAIAVVSANTTYTGFSWNITISGAPSTRGCFINGSKASHGVTVNTGTMIRLTDTSDYIIFSAEL